MSFKIGQESIQIGVIKLLNLVSDIDIVEMCKEKHLNLVSFIEYDDMNIYLDCPEKSCATGQRIHMNILAKIQDKTVFIDCICKIKAVIPEDDNRVRVDLLLVQYEKEIWENFKNMFIERQQELTELFEAMREGNG